MSSDGVDRREGRGRLSSIDMLPDDAEQDIRWALEQLRERTMPQTAILGEFNARLADRGIGGVSKSAFNRWSLRKAFQFRRLDEVRKITTDMIDKLGSDGSDQVTVAIAEMIKVSAYELLEDGVSSKGLQEIGRAVKLAVDAQRGSIEHREKLEARDRAKLAEAAKAVEDVGRKAGVSEETLAEINRQLGVV